MGSGSSSSPSIFLPSACPLSLKILTCLSFLLPSHRLLVLLILKLIGGKFCYTNLLYDQHMSKGLNIRFQRHLLSHGHCCPLHSSWRMGSIPTPVIRWMGSENVVTYTTAHCSCISGSGNTEEEVVERLSQSLP